MTAGEPTAERAPLVADRRRLVSVAAVIGVVVIAVVVAVLARRSVEPNGSVGNGGSGAPGTASFSSGSVPVSPGSTASTSVTSGSTPGPATSSGTSGTPTSSPSDLTDSEAATVVWPSPESDLRYDDPVEAARSFAVDLVGFDDPLLGAFREGDQRSGEIEIRALENGAATTVLVRRLRDGHWWVLGASTPDIELDNPTPGTAIDDPLVLSGRARAFEGTVDVAVFSRRSGARLGTGFVTGSGGTELGSFSERVAWSNPGGGWGVVVLSTTSAADGRIWQAMAIPVGFIGGD